MFLRRASRAIFSGFANPAPRGIALSLGGKLLVESGDDSVLLYRLS